MTASIDDFVASHKGIPMREIIAGLQETLRRNHLKILEAARSDWESKYAGGDPSDGCATVTIAARRSVKKRASKRTPASHWQSLN